MFTLLTRLFRPTPALPRPRHASETALPEPDDDRPRGCGWFDSSHELLSGVVVWEGIIVVDNTVTSPS